MAKIFANDNIQTEFDRWLSKIEQKDIYSSANTISIVDVLKAHFLIADYFSENGVQLVSVGPKDLNLLHSALYRQHVCYGGKCKYENKFDIVATLLFGIVKDHPFHDANKRTAFLSVLYFLEKLGYTPTVTDKQFEDFLVEIADDKIREKSRYKKLQEDYDDPDIRYISWYLKENTREIETRQYLITYKELKRILNGFNYDLKNPFRNSISVTKMVPKKLSFKKNEMIERTVLKIGFPSWTKQVPKGEIKRIRAALGLSNNDGVDSQVFYKDADPLETLILKYKEPLRRLADR